ncbi:MAG: hypothetical protein Kow0069_22580 [Promethearchaeota archaeon]
MIRDVYVIKDGIPVLARSWRPAEAAEGELDQTMLTGMLSAMSCFIEEMGTVGRVQAIRTSGNERITFHKPSGADDLLFVARSDAKVSTEACRAFLRRVSSKFLAQFGRERVARWDGAVDEFAGFEEQLETLREGMKWEVTTSESRPEPTENLAKNPAATGRAGHLAVPALVGGEQSRDDVKTHACHGPASRRIVDAIDGKKTVAQLAEQLGLPASQVAGTCTYLAKLGVVQFN